MWICLIYLKQIDSPFSLYVGLHDQSMWFRLVLGLGCLVALRPMTSGLGSGLALLPSWPSTLSPPGTFLIGWFSYPLLELSGHQQAHAGGFAWRWPGTSLGNRFLDGRLQRSHMSTGVILGEAVGHSGARNLPANLIGLLWAYAYRLLLAGSSGMGVRLAAEILSYCSLSITLADEPESASALPFTPFTVMATVGLRWLG